MNVTILGGGSWGTAVARHLALLGNDVMMWSHGAQSADGVNQTHRNPRYLPEIELPTNLRATTSIEEALRGSEAVVFVTPSTHLRACAREAASFLEPHVPTVVLTKGIEPDSALLMTEVVESELGPSHPVACLSGPNHAEEVALDMPSAAVVAGTDLECAGFWRDLFHSDRFRTYVSDDVVGVEVCAAAKNVIAIACGILRGYGYGDNTLALIMTRGLAEISRLVAARGGNPMTCMGLAGVGDLIATCTSPHSRNATFGAAFAKGETLQAYRERTHMVVEGANAVRSIRQMALRYEVEMPITDAVYALLYEDMALENVLGMLSSRPPQTEFYGI